jgi:hypothetical protein
MAKITRLIRALAAALVVGVGAMPAQAAQTSISGWTLTGPASTGITCTPASGAGTGNLAGTPLAGALPMAAGTVMFNCIVSPVGWLAPPSGVTLNDPALQVVNIVVPSVANTPTFSLALVAAGVMQAYPAGTVAVSP